MISNYASEAWLKAVPHISWKCFEDLAFWLGLLANGKNVIYVFMTSVMFFKFSSHQTESGA
jgi:hypothetical protein